MSPFYRRGLWGPEKFKELPEVIQPHTIGHLMHYLSQRVHLSFKWEPWRKRSCLVQRNKCEGGISRTMIPEGHTHRSLGQKGEALHLSSFLCHTTPPRGLGQEVMLLPHPILHLFLFLSCLAFPYPFKQHLWSIYCVPSTAAGAWLQR